MTKVIRTDNVKITTGEFKALGLVQTAELVGLKPSRLHELVSTGAFKPAFA
ncbi:MAG: hypothetical protein WBC04_23370 [Candidatus Acidiferrales bacterium]